MKFSGVFFVSSGLDALGQSEEKSRSADILKKAGATCVEIKFLHNV
jgi:hypothetical protein